MPTSGTVRATYLDYSRCNSAKNLRHALLVTRTRALCMAGHFSLWLERYLVLRFFLDVLLQFDRTLSTNSPWSQLTANSATCSGTLREIELCTVICQHSRACLPRTTTHPQALHNHFHCLIQRSPSLPTTYYNTLRTRERAAADWCVPRVEVVGKRGGAAGST